MIATVMPSWAARMPATYPPEPAPTTTRSYWRGTGVLIARRLPVVMSKAAVSVHLSGRIGSSARTLPELGCSSHSSGQGRHEVLDDHDVASDFSADVACVTGDIR